MDASSNIHLDTDMDLLPTGWVYPQWTSLKLINAIKKIPNCQSYLDSRSQRLSSPMILIFVKLTRVATPVFLSNMTPRNKFLLRI